MENEDPRQYDNVRVIDTNMFGFDRFNAAYLVEGKQIALIDTGTATSFEQVRSSIQEQGYSINDISYIFITHEHSDHCGNAGKLLKENKKAKVYAHPLCMEKLLNPAKEREIMIRNIPPHMVARFGKLEPIPPSRLVVFKDGDEFDLGEGHRLKVIFTPGHQPSGVVFYEEKNKGLFINDLVGHNFEDAGASIMLTPPKSDIFLIRKALKKIQDIPVNKLYCGHFGISTNPGEVIKRSLNNIDKLIDIIEQCKREERPDEIASEFMAFVMPEVDKIRIARDKAFYNYMTDELVPTLAKHFAKKYAPSIN